MTPDTRDAVMQAARLVREKRGGEAAALLRSTLRSGSLSPEDFQDAGRLLHEAFAVTGAARDVTDVFLAGQCTTAWLAQALTAAGWAHGRPLRVAEGGYDTVIQDLSGLAASPNAVVLLPWHQRLLAADARPATERIADEQRFLKQAWSLARSRTSRLVQVGYDWVLPGPFGYGGRAGGAVALVREINAWIRSELPEDACFVDLEAISAAAGHEAFYDLRGYGWTKQPFSTPGVCRLAQHLWAGIRALTTGPKKALVVDLDDTLWGGVVGELGPLGIELGESPEGEAFRAFQQHLRGLRERGVLLAVCTKNNPADAREPFRANPRMLLSLDDFAAFDASWDPKPDGLRRIAASLRLGLDSLVFFDDNPAEREHVRQALPDVEVVDAPADPADYLRALQEGLWFESAAFTAEDWKRADRYAAEQRRREAEVSAPSVDDYLSSLEMEAVAEPIADANLARVVQLLGRTNQFNLTTRRHGAEDVRRLLRSPRSLGLALRLQDRFGDYGLICAILAEPWPREDGALRIDTWLMSCRAIGRTVEDCGLNLLAGAATRMGHRILIGEYVPTAKNNQVADLYTRFGFRPLPAGDDGVLRFRLDLSAFVPRRTFVRCGAALGEGEKGRREP
jgi:FkbH-like protein